MNLVYGGYQHDVGDAEVSISREAVVSELGRAYAIRERWDVQGRLHGDNVAAVNAAVAALISAYSVDRRDIYLNGSTHAMRSADTLNGTRVAVPPSFPEGRGAENTTYRGYVLAVEGEFAYVGSSLLLSWEETVSIRGDGGPVWGFLEPLNGPPQMQLWQSQSVVYARQQGSAACIPNDQHRNGYGYHWLPADPIWPQWLHSDRTEISYSRPSEPYGIRTTNWSYEFSASIPLSAYPNAGGVVMHLS